jgi:hypothetical protein
MLSWLPTTERKKERQDEIRWPISSCDCNRAAGKCVSVTLRAPVGVHVTPGSGAPHARLMTTGDGNGRGRVQRRTWFSRRAMHDRSCPVFKPRAICAAAIIRLAMPRRAMGSTGRPRLPRTFTLSLSPNIFKSSD